MYQTKFLKTIPLSTLLLLCHIYWRVTHWTTFTYTDYVGLESRHRPQVTPTVSHICHPSY